MTAIGLQLPAIRNVCLKVVGLPGGKVETLVHGEMSAGEHRVALNASRYAAGVFFYRLEAGNYNATRKLLIIN